MFEYVEHELDAPLKGNELEVFDIMWEEYQTLMRKLISMENRLILLEKKINSKLEDLGV